MSIRLKVVLVVIGVMTPVFGLLLVVVTANTYRHSRDLEARMRNTLRPIIEAWVDREQWLDNHSWSDFILKLNRAQRTRLMKKFAVVDPDGNVKASEGMEKEEREAFLRGDEDLRRAMEEQAVTIYPDERYIAVPLSVEGVPCGAIKLEVNTGPQPTLQESFAEAFVSLAMILLVATFVLIASTYLLLDRRVLKPLGLLVGASGRVAEGNLNAEVPGVGGGDEMATLVSAFNAMMCEVRDYRDHLEKRVEEGKARVEAAQRRLVIAQRLAATGTLAAGIAHEVNNPLGGMINAARRILGDEDLKPKQREYLDLILEGLVRVQKTVEKILQFTPREVRPQAVDLRDVCEKAAYLVSHRLEKKSITVDHDFSADLPMVFGDPSELQQVFLNLIINAVDAVDEGGRIVIRGRLVAGNLEIEIQDDGCGMNDEQIQRAFDLFYTTKEAGKGSGLGLAIVHNIIENHHGRMEIKSRPGEGTTVWMQFPIITDPQSGRYKLVKA